MGNFWGGAPSWGSGNKTMSTILDPMDLFGYRAGATRDKVAEQQRAALAIQLNEQRSAYDAAVAQQKPYYDAGVNALNQLSTPGDIPLSAQYNRDMEQGSRALNRSLAASGQFRSSRAGNEFGNFYNQLSGAEASRRYNDALDPIKIAQSAMMGMNGASDTFGAGSAGAINNFSGQMANNALLYGQQRADAFNTFGQSANNALQSYASRPMTTKPKTTTQGG